MRAKSSLLAWAVSLLLVLSLVAGSLTVYAGCSCTSPCATCGATGENACCGCGKLKSQCCACPEGQSCFAQGYSCEPNDKTEGTCGCGGCG